MVLLYPGGERQQTEFDPRSSHRNDVTRSRLFLTKPDVFCEDAALRSPPGKYAKLFSALVIRTLLHQLQDVHASVEVATGQANANGCLVFVPRQDPNFDPR